MSPPRLPPGEYGPPFVGETLRYAKDPHAFMEERFQRYGPIFKTRLIGENLICLVGPEGFELFLDERHFTREGASAPHIEALLGTGTLPFVDGPAHTHTKRLVVGALNEPIERYMPAMSAVIERYLARWVAAGAVTWQPELERMVVALLKSVFFGADPGEDDAAFLSELRDFIAGIAAMPLNLPFTTYGRALRARDALIRRTEAVIAERRKEPRADVVSALLSMEDGGKRLSDDRIAAEMVHLLFAGHGGMTANLSYLCLAMGEQPRHQEIARAESAAVSPTRPFTAASLQRMGYLQLLWKETLRLYPTVPNTLFGRAKQDIEFKGFVIPSGWRAAGVIRATLIDGKAWADPAKFDPQRFVPPRSEHERHPCSFVAQGAGPTEGHRCAGEGFSAVAAKLFVALASGTVRWELEPGDHAIDAVALRPRDRLKVKISKLD